MGASTAEQTEMLGTPSDVLNGTPSPPVESRATPLSEIVKKLQTQQETTVFRLLTIARSSDEFRDLRRELFPKYRSLTGAISNLMRFDLSPHDFEQLVAEAFNRVGDMLKNDKQLLVEEGAQAKEEATFCINALHRAYKLVCQIATVRAPADRLAEDAKLLLDTVRCMWWSTMHFNCLVYAIHNEIVPSPGVQHEVLVGLRMALDAYAAAREAWGFRFDQALSQQLELLGLDEEDKDLARRVDEEYKHILRRSEQ